MKGVISTESLEKKNLLDAYLNAYRVQADLDWQLSNAKDKYEWLNVFQERATRMNELFRQNQEAIDAVRQSMNTALTAEEAEYLYNRVLEIRRQTKSDAQIPALIPSLLVTYYREQGDIEKVIRLYTMLYNLMFGYDATLSDNKATPRGYYSRQITELRNEYAKLKDPQARFEIFNAYYNICVTERSEGTVDVDVSHRYLWDMIELWNRDEVQKLDGNNEGIRWLVRRTEDAWLSVEADIASSSSEVQEYFCNLAAERYLIELSERGYSYRCTPSVRAAYYHSRVLQGKCSWDEAIRSCFMDYNTQLLNLGSEDFFTTAEEEAEFLLGTPMLLKRWLSECTDAELKHEVIDKLVSDAKTVLCTRFAHDASSTVQYTLIRWCSALLPYLESREEKEQLIFNLILVEQPPILLSTFVVAELAYTIGESMFRTRPELFSEISENLPDGQSVLEYIHVAALLHDLGKYVIGDIIKTQLRGLNTREMSEIRRHPLYGAKLIEGDPHLMIYYDVIMGHHRNYNGRGGYPVDFDITDSPFRFVAELVAICDSIAAATDSLGRVYSRAKSLNEVLDELNREKGTRYNPDIVEHIINSDELREILQASIAEQRGDLAYSIYTSSDVYAEIKA